MSGAVYTFTFDDGTRENIRLIDFDNPHNNVFEVLNQYVALHQPSSPHEPL